MQGPEHSSARIERFLQMSDENPYMLPKVSTAVVCRLLFFAGIQQADHCCS
jgi:2-oxoglutarate dehydrogenase complex dehydrogenase (E1) component-like enzyme